MACLKEVIDNSLEASVDCDQPLICVDLILVGHTLDTDEPATEPTLIVEDHGRGISAETLADLFLGAEPDTQPPQMEPGAEPLDSSCADSSMQRRPSTPPRVPFPRMGRAAEALHFFGDVVRVRSKQPGSNIIRHLVSDRQAARLPVHEETSVAMLDDPEELAGGYTIIHVTRLKPLRLQQLQDPAVICGWRMRAQQKYVFFVHKVLWPDWEDLPQELMRGARLRHDLRLLFFRACITGLRH